MRNDRIGEPQREIEVQPLRIPKPDEDPVPEPDDPDEVEVPEEDPLVPA